jgi:hypothetical protein
VGDEVTIEVASGRTLWREQRLAALRDELQAGGVGAVLRRPVETPSTGEKGTVESVVLLLGASAPLVGSALQTVRSIVSAWLARDHRTTLRLTRGDANLEIVGPLDESQQQALERFLGTTTTRDGGSGE